MTTEQTALIDRLLDAAFHELQHDTGPQDKEYVHQRSVLAKRFKALLAERATNSAGQESATSVQSPGRDAGVAPVPADLIGDDSVCCMDCGLLYRDFGHDTTLPDDQWRMLHDSEGGILCANCIARRGATFIPDAVALRARFECASDNLAAPALPEEPTFKKPLEYSLANAQPILIYNGDEYDERDEAFVDYATDLRHAAESHIAALRKRVEEAEQRANAKYQTVAKAVYETVQDSAATWETASDELIWGDYDSEGPEHQKISDAHLAATCVRFPQWADELKNFALRWNTDEPLTDEMLNEIEVTDESVERNTREMLRLIRQYDKVRKADERAEKAEADLKACQEARERAEVNLLNLVRAAEELVELKDLHDRLEAKAPPHPFDHPSAHLQATIEYRERKPLAWNALRQALNALEKERG